MFNEDEHIDFEDYVQISADVEFSFTDEQFSGLNEFVITEVKKVETKIKIENIELRKRNSRKSELF